MTSWPVVVYCMQVYIFPIIFALSSMQTILHPDMILLCSSMIKRKNCPVLIPPFRAKGARIKQGEHFLVYSI